MSVVMVERVFDEPITLDQALESDRATAWCDRLYRVQVRHHLLAADGRRLTCQLEAPDVEAVRKAIQRAGLAPPERLWPATLHLAGGASAEDGLVRGSPELVVVERSFAEPVAFPDVQAIEDRGAWCLDLYRVRHLRSYFALDQRRMICLYRAPDAEAVRRAQSQAGLPFERVWTATAFAPERQTTASPSA